eukprot:2031616-Amphidinium_carterae.1
MLAKPRGSKLSSLYKEVEETDMVSTMLHGQCYWAPVFEYVGPGLAWREVILGRGCSTGLNGGSHQIASHGSQTSQAEGKEKLMKFASQ